ncbi:hypothetical protein K502DRAFT_324671 [Neoconidiobolus thromboides FSU 785]|nr:hypothetical protein K502DRAFT_324671 [Neoconidiobolus thromboides FSU 785]
MAEPSPKTNNTSQIYNRDPWARREAFRKSPFFSRANTIRGLFPGFGIASVAFAIYCGAEALFSKKEEHH